VEKGVITLIGATTENPSFEVIGALLSRSQVYVLKPLGEDDLLGLLQRAMREDADLDEIHHAARNRRTDARQRWRCTALAEHLRAVRARRTRRKTDPSPLRTRWCTAVVQTNAARYDKQGEQHYDIVSAFIKCMRGSDPNAAVYWLARMVEGGEDPKFIARRMLILASEDIGNANPNALLMATTCMQAVQLIGWPEGRIVLSQCAIYLACSPKSNASYVAIGKAQAAVQQTGDLPVPIHLRNAPTKLMKDLGHGAGYRYSHDSPGGFNDQEFLPEALAGTRFYHPGDNGKEKEFAAYLRRLWGGKYLP
jgi:putative ATPase